MFGSMQGRTLKRIGTRCHTWCLTQMTKRFSVDGQWNGVSILSWMLEQAKQEKSPLHKLLQWKTRKNKNRQSCRRRFPNRRNKKMLLRELYRKSGLWRSVLLKSRLRKKHTIPKWVTNQPRSALMRRSYLHRVAMGLKRCPPPLNSIIVPNISMKEAEVR